MEITRRTDYAIRLIAALLEKGGVPLSVREAALQQDVPYAFARSIQHDLMQQGIVTSLRGAKGGMVLNVDPEKFTLFELIEIVQGPVSVAVCTNDEDWCPRSKTCQFHNVWEGANEIMRNYLSSVTIKDLLAGERAYISASSLLANMNTHVEVR